jgi:succinate dehydrogenase / fumarate reductase iron-sulfur subunit
VTINGIASLACQKLVKDYKKSRKVIIEPLSFFPIVKDLITDMNPFFERIRSIHPKEIVISNPVDVVKEISQSPEEHSRIVDAIKCVMCGCCSASCPVNSNEDPDYIGPAAVLRAKRYIFDSRLKDTQERMDKVEESHGVWSCETYWNCTKVCPKGIKVTQNILNLKTKLLENTHERAHT